MQVASAAQKKMKADPVSMYSYRQKMRAVFKTHASKLS